MDAHEVEETVEETKEEAKPWVIVLARVGYAAVGAVYIVIGLLAVDAAIGVGGATTNKWGALLAILQQPFGQFLLGFIAVGFFGYALWQFVRAFVDPEGIGTGIREYGLRALKIGAGIFYTLLAFGAIRLIFGFRGGGNGGDNMTEEDWTALVLAQPFGRWLIGIGGLIIVAVGLYQFYKSYKGEFRDEFKVEEMSEAEETWAMRVARIGYVARGIIIAVAGALLFQAAWQYDPQEAGDMSDALQAIAQQPFGHWLLGAVAVGLIAYGLYKLLLARYRRIYL